MTELLILDYTEKQKQQISELLARWRKIEGRLKQAEQVSQLAVVPAINELRYAGRMLVFALCPVNPTDDVPTIDDAIITAGQYLTNADHDISDALIYFFQQRVDEINGRFGAESVIQRFPNYRSLLDKLKLSRDLIIKSRQNIGDRRPNYEILSNEIIPFLIEKYFILDKSDAMMTMEVNIYLEKIKRLKYIAYISSFFSIIIALSAIGIYMFMF